MDASKKVWGAVCQGSPTGGEFKQFQMNAIHFQIDNTTALSYLVKMGGGTKNKYLIELAKEIWKYLLHHGITITAEYLPSSMNVEGDWQSRNSKDKKRQMFHKIC